MSRVYVVQDSPLKNLSIAKKYGEFRVLLGRSDDLKGPEHMIRRLSADLIGIEPNDYLLPVGNPLAIGLAFHIVLNYVSGINVLKWDRGRYEYDVVRVEVDDEYGGGPLSDGSAGNRR